MINPKILAFNMNIENVILCDQYYDNKTQHEIPSSGFLFKRHKCYNPLFFDDIIRQINYVQPILVIITTEEYQDGYFHSDFLPNNMYQLNYEELSTYKYNSINMSIYVRLDVSNECNIVGYDKYTYGNVDSLVIYCETPYGTIACVGMIKPDTPRILDTQAVNNLINSIINQYINVENVTNVIIMGYIDNYLKELNYNYINVINVGANQFTIKAEESTLIEYGKFNGLITSYEITRKSPKILCFSWNTDKTPLCDEYHKSKTVEKRVRFFQESPCFSPSFFTQIYDKIKLESPDIVVINTEGDLEKGTFFHHEFLKTHMNHYYLLDNDKITGIANNEALRISIYVRNDMKNVKLINLNFSLFFNNNIATCKIGSKVSKSIVRFVNTDYGIFAFMGLQFPHSYTQIQRNDCFKTMTQKLLSNNKISYVFIMGDFSAGSHDEISLLDNSLINDYTQAKLLNYNELNIVPNYKLKYIGESERANYKITLDKFKVYGWHDRIFYKTVGLTTYNINCIYYDNVFGFPMLNVYTNSQHLGVMGLYELDTVVI